MNRCVAIPPSSTWGTSSLQFAQLTRLVIGPDVLYLFFCPGISLTLHPFPLRMQAPNGPCSPSTWTLLSGRRFPSWPAYYHYIYLYLYLYISKPFFPRAPVLPGWVALRCTTLRASSGWCFLAATPALQLPPTNFGAQGIFPFGALCIICLY